MLGSDPVFLQLFGQGLKGRLSDKFAELLEILPGFEFAPFKNLNAFKTGPERVSPVLLYHLRNQFNLELILAHFPFISNEKIKGARQGPEISSAEQNRMWL